MLLVALAAWALWPTASVAAGLLAYLFALILVNAAIQRPAVAKLADALTRPQRWLLAALVVAAPLAIGWRSLAGGPVLSSLQAAAENTRDRLATQQTPAISPPLVVSYQPQRFLIHAPEASEVAVRWTSDSPLLPAVQLGHGVFMLDYDPHGDSQLKKQPHGALRVTLNVDGIEHQRTLQLAHPQPHPRWLRSAPQFGLAATVSEETDELVLVRRDGSHQRFAVGDGPCDCAIFAEGRRIAVAHRYCDELWIVNADDGKIVARRHVGLLQTRLAAAPNGKTLAIGLDGPRRGVCCLSLPEANEPLYSPLAFAPDWLEFGRDGDELVATDRRGAAVWRLHKLTGKRLAASDAGTAVAPTSPTDTWQAVEPPILLPRPVATMGRAAAGGRLLLATTAAPLGPEPIRANHFVQNTIHELSLHPWAILSTHITDQRGLSQDAPGDTEHGVSPLGIAPFGDAWLVAFAGSNEVTQMTLTSDMPVRCFPLGDFPLFGPHSAVDLGEGCWCVSSPSDGAIGVFDNQEVLPKLIRLAAADEELEKLDPAALEQRRGEQTFYEAARAGISCQSCHLHADTDFSRQDIGGGMAYGVLSVRGVAGTSPYLRDASNARLRDLHHVARDAYRDYQRGVNWDRAAALAAYMESLPAAPHAGTLQEPDVERLRAGVAAFFKASCNQCHAPPAMTNLGQHPTRLLFPKYAASLAAAGGREMFLDTPSLRSVAASAPYLHDGRATSLRAVLVDENRENRHGNVQSLSADELTQLIYFLESL